MSNLGTLIVSRTNDDPDAVARVHLYGPRGGIMGSVLIGSDDAHDAIKQLGRLLNHTTPASKLDSLLNAAEAALDSDAGVKSMSELAAALAAIDPKRDYRSDYQEIS